jgi:hypothetical protein
MGDNLSGNTFELRRLLEIKPNQKIMKATIQFINSYGRQVLMEGLLFNDKRHMNNFINYTERKYNYTFDEVWY